jgi:mono/diheme cytochrome c family protein
MTSLAAALVVFTAGIFTAAAQPSNDVTTAPVYVPDLSHANEPLPDGVLAWDDLTKATDATNEQDFARFTFSFTNVTAGNVTILAVHPSCGCTTAEMPPVPWTIPPGESGQMKLNVNLAFKSGMLFKTVNVSTDKGNKTLTLRINILPPVIVKMSEEDRAKGLAAAKVDRQAVFKGDCASCHLKHIEGKYGQPLFAAICAVCHEAENRATMVPDLHNLPVPTSEEFWRTWITAGKAGSLMPAFATSQGGPLNDMQIASLAAYLNAVIPPKAAAPVPAPAK